MNAAVTIVEHVLFDQASTAGGTAWDRSVFAGVALQTNDQLQTTYDLSIQAGG